MLVNRPAALLKCRNELQTDFFFIFYFFGIEISVRAGRLLPITRQQNTMVSNRLRASVEN